MAVKLYNILFYLFYQRHELCYIHGERVIIMIIVTSFSHKLFLLITENKNCRQWLLEKEGEGTDFFASSLPFLRIPSAWRGIVPAWLSRWCCCVCFSQVPDDPTLEELSPRVPRAVFVKQDNGGSASVIPVSSARGPPGEEEKEEAPNSPDLSTCSATYSNLGEWTLTEKHGNWIRFWVPFQGVKSLFFWTAQYIFIRVAFNARFNIDLQKIKTYSLIQRS